MGWGGSLGRPVVAVVSRLERAVVHRIAYLCDSKCWTTLDNRFCFDWWVVPAGDFVIVVVIGHSSFLLSLVLVVLDAVVFGQCLDRHRSKTTIVFFRVV